MNKSGRNGSQSEQTLLYQIITHMTQQDQPLPNYIQREFENYLKCSNREHGFCRCTATPTMLNSLWCSVVNSVVSAPVAEYRVWLNDDEIVVCIIAVGKRERSLVCTKVEERK